jgi:pimeloyl-[acyl-carrier protein] methyl ester esterase
MTLHCDSFGAGPDVVLVHGWGWHGGVWYEVARLLAQQFRVWIPDLPGHGRSRNAAGDFTLDAVVEATGYCVPSDATWIGWSLGGVVAMQAARRGLARKLVLVSTTPRILEAPDWPCGQTRAWFENFAQGFSRDVARALERFASLHLSSERSDSVALRRLRREQARAAAPDDTALHGGLQLLEQIDMRRQLGEIDVPALVIHGRYDQVVPCAAGEYLARNLPRARFVAMDDAGHAPFLLQPQIFVETVREFLRERA